MLTCFSAWRDRATARFLFACFAVTVLTLGLSITPGSAVGGPSPPCRSAMPVAPPFAPRGAAPTVALWRDLELTAIPGCPASLAGRFQVVLALAGATEAALSLDALAAKVGAVSTMRGLKYWSVTDRSWRALFNDVHAVPSADDLAPRADFSAFEVLSGETLYFLQDDTRSSGRTVYALKTHEHSADSLTFETYNVTAVNLFLLRLFEPGSLRSIHFLQRDGERWSYYGLSLVRRGGRSGSERSFVNRAAAYFRHLSGVPSDRNPPLAP